MKDLNNIIQFQRPTRYTATGNITTFGSASTLAYNKANQLASATLSSNTSTYGYDAFGQRLTSKPGSSAALVYQYDQDGNIVTEFSSAGVETDYVYAGNYPIAVIQPAAGTISYIHTDKLGTPVKATDASKTVNWSATYDPNGKPTITGSLTQNYRLPGMRQENSLFNHNGARDFPYSNMERYFQADPLGLAAGLNPYIYAGNNPYSYTDPLGLIPFYLRPLIPQYVLDNAKYALGQMCTTLSPSEVDTMTSSVIKNVSVDDAKLFANIDASANPIILNKTQKDIVMDQINHLDGDLKTKALSGFQDAVSKGRIVVK